MTSCFASLGPKAAIAGCFALILAQFGMCQASPAPADAKEGPEIPALAVTSVRPNPKAAGWRLYPTDDGWSGMGVSMHTLLDEACGPLHQDKIEGWPQWADGAKFDIEGKVDDADLAAYQKLGYEQKKLMLQALLADRFKLKVHFEPQMQPVFLLTVAKGGANLKQTTPDELPSGMKAELGYIPHSRPGEFEGINMPMSSFIQHMTWWAGRVVVDKTGLTGHYDFELKWTPDSEFGPGRAVTGDGNVPLVPAAPAGPSIFTAVEEQLGLKLEPNKAPIPVLVIDHIEEPGPN
jgi:uncharacterized protein (TIGR03435 family)